MCCEKFCCSQVTFQIQSDQLMCWGKGQCPRSKQLMCWGKDQVPLANHKRGKKTNGPKNLQLKYFGDKD